MAKNTHKVYIITDRSNHNLHVGLCMDLVKTMRFYNEMPTMFFDKSMQLNKLVYTETFDNDADAMARFKEVSVYTRKQKEDLIKAFNTILEPITAF